MTRNIPKSVRKTLRREVNFGCPVDGCGSPYLSYHHFDPPWHMKKHHNAKGMVALCLEHHKQADYGAFSKQQLLSLKKNPFLKSKLGLQGRFNWKRANTVFELGGSVFLGAQHMYVCDDYCFLWLSGNKHVQTLLNFDIKSKGGELKFSMRNNDWVSFSNFDDIESIPSGKRLLFQSKKHELKIDITFNNFNKEDFEDKRKNIFDKTLISEILERLEDDVITTCSIKGNLTYPFKMSMKPGKTIIDGTGKDIIAGFSRLTNVKQIVLSSYLNIGSGVMVKNA